jgi:Raf kinase inhibitor-like YbhB/YbcL family protein
MKGFAMGKRTVILLLLGAVLFGCEARKPAEVKKEKGKKMDIEVTSPAFGEGESMPATYTADGEDISPPLEWTGVPEGAKSIALINDDPDAPVGTWVHWVLYNIPPDVTSLEENMPPDETLANGARQGTTDFGRIGYGGPAPPSGTHRYFFKVYALDTMLDLPTGATKRQVGDAMQGHVLAEGQLMGKYSRR